MNSFIKWIGGKNSLKKKIIKRFPENYKKYIEVFGGAGWVLFYKEHKGFEVYNDLNSHLVNLFTCTKYHASELQRELSFLLNARELFNDIKESYNIKGLTDIQRAAKFFMLIKLSYGSRLCTYGCSKKDVNGFIRNIEVIQERLSTIVIENKDFGDLIKNYDSKDSFFYLDPPYYGAEKFYQVPFTQEDHIRLFESLKNIKGKFLLSYNDCDYIKDLYDCYNIECIERANNLTTKCDTRYNYKELLVKNY